MLTAARKLPASEREKLVHRLYLRWHPDKNPTGFDVANEAFKFLLRQVNFCSRFSLLKLNLLNIMCYGNCQNPNSKYHLFLILVLSKGVLDPIFQNFYQNFRFQSSKNPERWAKPNPATTTTSTTGTSRRGRKGLRGLARWRRQKRLDDRIRIREKPNVGWDRQTPT